MRHVVAAGVCAGLLAAPAAVFAQSGWFDLAVPGSLDRILGPGFGSLEGPRLLRDLIATFHDPAVVPANRPRAQTVRACLEDLQRLRIRWGAVEQAAGEVSLRAAAGGDRSRRALEAFLEMFGLRLMVGDDSASRVVPHRDEARRRRVAAREASDSDGGADRPAAGGNVPGGICGAGDGWRSVAVERRLNAGEAITWDLPRFVVSLPLSPRLWLAAVYGENAGSNAAAGVRAAGLAADLVGRLLTESRPAQLYLGLAALDEETLAWLQRHPRALSRLGRKPLAAFARFGGDLQVRDDTVRVPGGAAAVPFWERLVGASVTDPERFVERLFERSSGRVAHAYHLVARLPELHQRFVLGAWQADARERRRGLATLQRVLEALPPPPPLFADPGTAGSEEVAVDIGLLADSRPGESVCGVPSDEAIALAWDTFGRWPGGAVGGVTNPLGHWFACGSSQCTYGGNPNERGALDRVLDSRRGEPRYVCRVEAVISDFPNEFSEAMRRAERTERIRLPASMYRLGYPLTGADLDPRQFIVP